MKFDWKKEHVKSRYIDSITDEEAKHIAWLGQGKPEIFEVTNITREINPNNIPHVTISYTYHEVGYNTEFSYTLGIFADLNIYLDVDSTERFESVGYNQKEIFKYFTEIGLD